MRSGGTFRVALVLALVVPLVAACYPSLGIEPAGLPDATVGQPYSATISATGQPASEVMAMSVIATPELPGLDFTFAPGTATGTLAGTPRVAGTFHFTVTADGVHFNSGGAHGEREYTLVIH